MCMSHNEDYRSCVLYREADENQTRLANNGFALADKDSSSDARQDVDLPLSSQFPPPAIRLVSRLSDGPSSAARCGTPAAVWMRQRRLYTDNSKKADRWSWQNDERDANIDAIIRHLWRRQIKRRGSCCDASPSVVGDADTAEMRSWKRELMIQPQKSHFL